jgi:hypothetical protein
VYLLLLQDFSWWTGTYGGMIRSDLHGAESPTDGRCDPTRGKEKTEGCTRKKEEHCTKDTPTDLDQGGFFLSTWTLTLEST